MAKARTSRYEPGKRARSWLKIKARREQELVVVGYEPGGGGRHGPRRSPGGHLGGRAAGAMRARSAAAWTRGRGPSCGASWTSTHCRSHPCQAPRPCPRPAGRSRARSSARSSRNGHQMACCARRSSRAGRSGVTRGAWLGSPWNTRGGSGSRFLRTSRTSRTLALGLPHPSQLRASSGRISDRRSLSIWSGRQDDRRAPAEAVTRAELAALDGAGRRRPLGGRRACRRAHQPGQGAVPGCRLHQAGPGALLHDDRAGDPALPAGPAAQPASLAGRHRRAHALLAEAAPRHAPEWVARWDYPEAGTTSRTRTSSPTASPRWPGSPTRPSSTCTPGPAGSPSTGGRRTRSSTSTPVRADHLAGGADAGPALTARRSQHLGVRGYPKVTGKRGIQVWIHVEPRYTFDETRDWVGQLSRGVGAVVPDLVSWEWGEGRSRRQGAPRLTPRTRIIKTLVAPYAVRPVASRRSRRPSPGTSWTTRRCDRTAGTSARSSGEWSGRGISSAACWRTPRSCLRSRDRVEL